MRWQEDNLPKGFIVTTDEDDDEEEHEFGAPPVRAKNVFDDRPRFR